MSPPLLKLQIQWNLTGLVPRGGLCGHLQKGVLSVLLTRAQEGPGSALSPCSERQPCSEALEFRPALLSRFLKQTCQQKQLPFFLSCSVRPLGYKRQM